VVKLGFRYDTQHLTPQQRVIVELRDKNDRIRAEEAKRKSKESCKIDENEELFIRLCLMYQIDSQGTKELIDNGYITKDLCDTNKAKEFKKRFIEAHKERLYVSMKESNNDIPYSMKRVGLNEYISFQFISDELFDEGRFVKDIHGEHRVK
jgi:hypothetical protein